MEYGNYFKISNDNQNYYIKNKCYYVWRKKFEKMQKKMLASMSWDIEPGHTFNLIFKRSIRYRNQLIQIDELTTLLKLKWLLDYGEHASQNKPHLDFKLIMKIGDLRKPHWLQRVKQTGK